VKRIHPFETLTVYRSAHVLDHLDSMKLIFSKISQGLRWYKTNRKGFFLQPNCQYVRHNSASFLPVDTFSWRDAGCKKCRHLQKKGLPSRNAFKINLFYGEDAASRFQEPCRFNSSVDIYKDGTDISYYYILFDIQSNRASSPYSKVVSSSIAFKAFTVHGFGR
jgi:hypothetical protein